MPQALSQRQPLLSAQGSVWRRGVAIAGSIPVLLSSGLLALWVTPAAAQSRGVNYISAIQGRVEVNGNRAYVGDFVRGTYHLRVPSGGSVGVVCHNQNRPRFFSPGTYIIQNYCQGTPRHRSGRRRHPRTFDSTLPYIFSPRNTGLLGVERPVIRWNAVAGAQSYTLVVSSSDETEPDWSVTVEDTEVTYDGPPLRRDRRYRLLVETDNGLSSRTDIDVGFTVLSAPEVARVEAAVAELREMALDPDAEALGLALVYQGYVHSDRGQDTNSPLYQTALAVLQERIDAGTENSLIYAMQGDIFLAIGLPLPAQERYQEALTLATAAGHLQGQANSLEGLALVAQGEHQYCEAITHAEAALVAYTTLGDEEQIEELEARLTFLRSQ